MKPVDGSAITDRSGTMRIVAPVAIPGALCQLGRDQIVEAPPPPAPPLESIPSFQMVSISGLVFDTVRPPTPVTKGWLAGSSTAGAELVIPAQSEEPASPAADRK